MQARRALIVPFILMALAAVFTVEYLARGRDLSFDKFLNNRSRVRTAFNQVDAWLEVRALGRRDLGNIRLGVPPWLFYVTDHDGDSRADLLGRGTPEASARWVAYVRQCAENPFGTGARYLFVSPPSKESVFPEVTALPVRRYVNTSNANRHLVSAALSRFTPEAWIDLQPTLVGGKSRWPTYFYTDTHWTNWGAYLASREIRARLRPDSVGAPWPELMPGERFAGDIGRMLRGEPAGLGVDLAVDRETMLNGTMPRKPDLVDGDLWIWRNRYRTGVLWIVGDSFRERLAPFFWADYGLVVAFPFNQDRRVHMRAALQQGAPKVVLQVVTERFLGQPIPPGECAPP